MKNIVNIINFIRATEPRRERDLVRPVAEQVRLAGETGLPSTFLLQYDALISDTYVDLVKSCENCEYGLWLELVQPLVEAAGAEWRGRYAWDWFSDCGFTIGYTPGDRAKIADTAMERFKSVFGYYPRSVGSWFIDAFTMKYIADKYDISAFCICRDQVGTDGYTMQGGYWNQAYYPSVNNMFCPAQTPENQISVPVFRMLGSDPIYCYDYLKFGYAREEVHMPTLEPTGAGKKDFWVNWFFDETFGGSGISFQYTQAGQENSFGWEKMGDGLELQYPCIKKLNDSGKVEVMTLAEAGEWYKDQFAVTPAASITAMSDWLDGKRKSVWFYNRFYRVNLFWDGGVVRIRDMYLFNEDYKEKYLDRPCSTHACEFRNLPVMDGAIYSAPDEGVTAGIYLTADGENVVFDSMEYAEKGSAAVVTLTKDGKKTVITMNERGFAIESSIPGLTLVPAYSKSAALGGADIACFGNCNNRDTVLSYVERVAVDGNTVRFRYDGFDYSVTVKTGALSDRLSVLSADGKIEIAV